MNICNGCKREKKYYAKGVCANCYKRIRRLLKNKYSVDEIFNNNMLDGYWLKFNEDGTFKKGNTIGKHTQFKKGHTPANKGKRENYQRNHHTYRKDLNIKKGEVVHHIDGDYLNNNPENIIVFKNHSEHMKYHWQQQKEKGRMKKVKRFVTNGKT